MMTGNWPAGRDVGQASGERRWGWDGCAVTTWGLALLQAMGKHKERDVKGR